MIQVGEKLPSQKLSYMGETGPTNVPADELFAGKKVVLFSVPGAFTPTCSEKHLPGFLEHADAIRDKGVDLIACMAVNDAFVMNAWGKDHSAGDRVMMIADGNGDFSRAIGLELDASNWQMGTRSQRFAMVLNDGTVEQLYVEKPGEFQVSTAENVLANL